MRIQLHSTPFTSSLFGRLSYGTSMPSSDAGVASAAALEGDCSGSVRQVNHKEVEPLLKRK